MHARAFFHKTQNLFQKAIFNLSKSALVKPLWPLWLIFNTTCTKEAQRSQRLVSVGNIIWLCVHFSFRYSFGAMLNYSNIKFISDAGTGQRPAPNHLSYQIPAKASGQW